MNRFLDRYIRLIDYWLVPIESTGEERLRRIKEVGFCIGFILTFIIGFSIFLFFSVK